MSFMSSMFGGSGSPSGQSTATAAKMIGDQAAEQKKLEDEAASYDPLIAAAITKNLGLATADQSRRDVIARGNPWMTTGYGGVGSARTLGQAYLLGT